MTQFTARNRSSATLKSSREQVWKALTDPVLLTELTPYLRSIDVDGDRWTWRMASIPVLGKSVGTTFTEVMTFEEPHRICYVHDDAHADETTWVEGEYLLDDVSTGTHVAIDLRVTADLPFPAFMRPGVEAAMSAVMAGMGRVFARNLLRHLGER